MKKLFQYGMLLVGILLCLYAPVSNVVRKQEWQSQIPYQQGVIGVIEIPDIDVNLPIYNGTEEEILSKGIGHIEESSSLGGGVNTHCLLAGHRGLPNADIFRRLNELKEGELFVIHVSDRKLLYEVCQVQVIRPEDTEVLQIQEGKDLVSLITCTPYGINTHRLVVTGERKICDE